MKSFCVKDVNSRNHGLSNVRFVLKVLKHNTEQQLCILSVYSHTYVLIHIFWLTLRRSCVLLWEHVTITSSDRNPIKPKVNIFDLPFLNCTLLTFRRLSRILLCVKPFWYPTFFQSDPHISHSYPSGYEHYFGCWLTLRAHSQGWQLWGWVPSIFGPRLCWELVKGLVGLSLVCPGALVLD